MELNGVKWIGMNSGRESIYILYVRFAYLVEIRRILVSIWSGFLWVCLFAFWGSGGHSPVIETYNYSSLEANIHICMYSEDGISKYGW